MTPLTVHVTAKAHASRILRWDGQRLFVHLQAPPHDNLANQALVRLLAELFSVPKTTIHLKSGAHAREKQVVIPLPAQAVFDVLNRLQK